MERKLSAFSHMIYALIAEHCFIAILKHNWTPLHCYLTKNSVCESTWESFLCICTYMYYFFLDKATAFILYRLQLNSDVELLIVLCLVPFHDFLPLKSKWYDSATWGHATDPSMLSADHHCIFTWCSETTGGTQNSEAKRGKPLLPFFLCLQLALT